MADGGSRNTLAVKPADGQAALVERARAGDARAFERLYRETCGRVHAICLRLAGGDRALAEDCVQEAYVRAWKALPRFEARSALGTWLHRIAVNVVLERRRRPAAHLEFVEQVPETDLDDAFLDTPVEEAEIETAIASLPPGARDVLVLCAIHGYSHPEAAQMLGIAEGTCKAQLHRARRLLRTRLDAGGHA
jgi:RNA polymerase sigma-70 factor (ECF subfamily)